MKLYTEKKDCCGCSACEQVCPTKAITFFEDNCGFKYPIIDDKKCINCDLCIKVCPLKKSINTIEQKNIYAAKNKDNITREKSSSGGIFFEIAKSFIEDGGYVYGAIFNEKFEVTHYGTNEILNINKFSGSKYVQSDNLNSYKEIKKLLLSGNKVLYSGVACQIFGLKTFLLNINQDNLYTCDIVCHGVPSPDVFKKYLEKLKKQSNSDINDFSFRYKNESGTQNISVIFDNNSKYINTSANDVYYKLFSRDIILRDSCYDCHFTNMNRTSDITLGDFWGIEKTIHNFDDNKGVSLVLINSDKGSIIFDKISNKFDLVETNKNDCLQPQLISPVSTPKNREYFFKKYNIGGFDYACKYIFEKGIKNRLKHTPIYKIYKLVRK